MYQLAHQTAAAPAATKAPHTTHFIGGQWICPGGPTFPDYNPFNGEWFSKWRRAAARRRSKRSLQLPRHFRHGPPCAD